MQKKKEKEEIESEYKNLTTTLIKKFGYRPLNDLEINKYCKKMFGNKYYKCISVDEPIPQRDCYFIINTDVLKGNGIHWCTVIKRGKTLYVYDSFGRKTNKILKIFYNNSKKQGYGVKDSEYDHEQKGNLSSSCGHRCIASLKIADKYGIKAFLCL